MISPTCGCTLVWLTERTVYPCSLDRAQSVACSCCGAPTLVACGESGETRIPVTPSVRWGYVCPGRLAHVTQQGEQMALG